MRIKLDENMPASLAEALGALGHDAQTVPEEGLRGRDDPTIWEAAQLERRFLVTQDRHFSDLRSFPPGTHYGILLVRLRAPSRRTLAEKVALIFRTEDVEQWAGCFVVASDRSIRRLRPPKLWDGQTMPEGGEQPR